MNKALHPNYTIVHELIETAKHGSLVDLPAASEHILTEMPAFDHSLDQILSARQSTRFFDQEKAISYEHLMKILENNKEFQRTNWFEDFEEGTSIEQYVLARRVEKDLEFKNDRIYEYCGQELIPLNDICLTEIINEIFLQKENSLKLLLSSFLSEKWRGLSNYMVQEDTIDC
ncbi:hypothetical protein LC048_19520 [Mesobacillus subterraneus]|uniref:hypothetical protein n=1 Tax=Mesobacillus subterraneus TaxID=285983 RepID=UPI00273F5FBE|nr:hypothetical protein [Mesobacillus subterraneus]WLR54589.1 hypothetical protein LC048_19520 [Mesobacillus subterraneus]